MKRDVKIVGDTAFVTLTKGYTARLDAADVPLLGIRNWCSTVTRDASGEVRNVYANARILNKLTYMHRIIIGEPPVGMFVDHIDGDGLNNKRSNLRFATKAQNAYNSRHI